MKKAIFPLACVLAVALQAFSCKEKEPEIVQQTLTVSPSSLSFEPEDASAKLLNVSSNSTWGVAPSADWIIVEKGSGDGSGSITVRVSANTGEDRTGTIIIKGMNSANVKAASDVTVHTKEGKRVTGTVEVNRPMKADGWKIYQYGYDVTRGPESAYSEFLLVRDPWLPWVYAGIFMMLAGALCLMLLMAPKPLKP